MKNKRLFSDYVSELTSSTPAYESGIIHVRVSCLSDYAVSLMSFIGQAVDMLNIERFGEVIMGLNNFEYQDETYTSAFFYFKISRDDFKSFLSFMDRNVDVLATTVWCNEPFDPKADIYERYVDGKSVAYIHAKKT